MTRRSLKRGTASAKLREHMIAIRACEKSGESLKSYAEHHGVSVHALYQAKKAARKQGLLPPHRATRSTGTGPQTARQRRFVEARPVASMPPPIRPTWRIRFASGEVLESDAPLSMDDVVRLAVRIRGQS
jgi:transposase-like protein